jgi:hypothetical protein
MDRKDMVVGALINGMWYNVVEVTLIALIAGTHLMGGEVNSWILWLAFGAAALWTVLASTHDAQDDVKELVMHREVFITDFLMGAFLLLGLSTMTMQYGLQYGAIFFVAAIQNLRYSAMAYDWLQEERRDRKQSKRNNLPRV